MENMDSYTPSMFMEPGNIYPAAPVVYTAGSIIHDQYRVERILQGGIGRVYQCVDMTTGQEKVVKSVNADPYRSPAHQDRLAEEIHNWMRLPRCANLVNIGSVFYDNKEQSLFYTMPFLRGHPVYGLELEAWKKTYRFTEPELLYIGLSICNAMRTCLRKTGKVPVHGDIKPSNILLEYRGEQFAHVPVLGCTVRLSDCGIFGYTVPYFPQEYRKKNRPQDNASDVYAWIMVMAELEEHAAADYDRDDSIISLLYDLLIKQGQWRIYDLVEIMEDLLIPAFRKKYGADPETLLPADGQTRSEEIFNRVQDIHSELQMVRRNISLLEEIETLWQEAEKQGYTLMQEIPLTCCIDRHYFVCAGLCEKNKLAEKILTRFEQAFYRLSGKQQKVFGFSYSPVLEDDFKIRHGLHQYALGNRDRAADFFCGVKIKKCICLNWLEQYVSICSAAALRGHPEEGQCLKRKLQECINTCVPEYEKTLLPELKRYLGSLLMHLGETQESVRILEEMYGPKFR